MALPTQGTTLTVNSTASPEVATTIGEVIDITGPTSSRGEIDVTSLESAAKEFLLELPDHGELSLNCNVDVGDAGQQLLNTLFETDPPPAQTWIITLPTDTDAGHSSGTTITGVGRISGHELGISTDTQVTVAITIRNTGARTIVWGT